MFRKHSEGERLIRRVYIKKGHNPHYVLGEYAENRKADGLARSERRLGGLGQGFMRTEDISRGARQEPGAETKALRSAWSMDRTGLCNQVNMKKRGPRQEDG